MDITPHVNLLKSLRGKRIDYVLLCGEAIDNSFDAGSSRIDVLLDDKEIIFQDNGLGVSFDRLKSILSLGEHGPMTTTNLGRFGIGIKSQAVNAGNLFSVVSVSVDGRVKVEVDWRKILKSGQWKVDDPRWLPVAIGTSTGTTITIGDLRETKQPSGGWQKRIVADIAERFYPAITAGQRITINSESIEVLPEPKMTDIVERQIPLGGNRGVHVRAGILVSPSKLHKVHVAYKHRVIMPASTIGCGEYGGLTKMFARLQLSGPWHLAEFKNDLTDDVERSELEEAVEAVLKPILEKCNSASMSARLNEIAHLINQSLPPELVSSRPHRQNKDKSTTPAKSRGKNGTVDQDKSDVSGPAKARRPPSNWLLVTFDGINEDDGIGSFQPGRPLRVNLSRDNPYVARLCEQRDQSIIVDSLKALALMIFEQGREQVAPELPFESFGKRVANHLAAQDGDASVRVQKP